MTQLLKSNALLRLCASRVAVIMILHHCFNLFDSVMPSNKNMDNGGVDSTILQNNTVSVIAETPVSFITAELSSLKYVDICLSGNDSHDGKRVSALRDSGAEICVANSSVVEGLNLDRIGQIQLRPFCGNSVTADLVCLKVSLAGLDVPNIRPNHVVRVICAVVPDLHDKFILTVSVIDRGRKASAFTTPSL